MRFVTEWHPWGTAAIRQDYSVQYLVQRVKEYQQQSSQSGSCLDMHLKKRHGNIEEWDPDSGMEVLGFSILLSHDPGCGLSCHLQMRPFAQMASEVLHSSKDLKVSVIYFTYSFSSF